MKKATKGALFSGLVFPGLGQIVLKHYLRGAVIVVTVLASLTLFIMKAVENALTIVEQMELDGGSISMDDITEAANRASAASVDPTLNLALMAILFCWIAGTIDAWWVGRKMDLQELEQTNTDS
jgi:ABC-type sulfate transport system permease component